MWQKGFKQRQMQNLKAGFILSHSWHSAAFLLKLTTV